MTANAENTADHRGVERVPLDATEFRSVLSRFATGVVVLTGRDAEGEPVGMTIQSFTSLSLDPPLILVCPGLSSSSWPRFAGDAFAVNILGESQREISGLFSRSGADKFAGVAWSEGAHGLPLLDGAIAHLECAIEAVHPGGDHHIVVGRVLTLAATEDRPLAFFRSGYWAVAEHPAIATA